MPASQQVAFEPTVALCSLSVSTTPAFGRKVVVKGYRSAIQTRFVTATHASSCSISDATFRRDAGRDRLAFRSDIIRQLLQVERLQGHSFIPAGRM